ncbi:MAG: hypothetical protein ACXABK_04920, partial [Candidatus Heimdallarchaeaceae archaeon]
MDSSLTLLNITSDSSHTNGELSYALGENVTFQYHETYSESSLNLSISDVNLSRYGELHLFFIVEGDQSLKSGLVVTFLFELWNLEFIIERPFQDGSEHHLVQGYLLDSEFAGDLNLTLRFQGQSPFGKNGSLTIVSHTYFTNNQIIEITETSQLFHLPTNSLLVEGESLGSNEINILTVVENNFNDSYNLNMDISFIALDFFAFKREVLIFINSIETESINIVPDSTNNFELKLDLDLGFNEILFAFHFEMSVDIIQITDFLVNGFSEEKFINSGIFFTLEWSGNIDESINLSAFKPPSVISDQILNISLCLSFEGTKIYSGVDFSILQNQIKLENGEISSFQQTEELFYLQLETFTTNYQEDLYLVLSA